jgi:hypothetical protein
MADLGTWIGTGAGILSLVLSAAHLARKREFYKPKLHFKLGHGPFPKRFKGVRGTHFEQHYIFFFSSQPRELLSSAPVVLQVANFSKKPIENVSIQVEIPAARVVTNSEMRSATTHALEHPADEDRFADDVEEHIISRREVNLTSSQTAIVRYNVGN